MPWARYTNDIAVREQSIDLALGWFLDEEVDKYKKGTFVSKEIIADLKTKGIKYIQAHFKKIEVGDQVRTPVSLEVHVVVEIEGSGGERIVIVEPIGKNTRYRIKAPEFNQATIKKKGKSYKGDLALWTIWVDEEADSYNELGFEPEEDDDEDDEEIYSVL